MLEQFLQTIITDFHLEHESPEKQEQAIGAISQRMQQTLLRTALFVMPKEELVHLENFLETKPSSEQLESYITQETAKIPDLDKALTQALLHEYEMLKATYTR